MPRFTLKDLFWCVTLIGLGLGGFCYVETWQSLHRETQMPALNSWLLAPSGAALGAGIGAIFQRKPIGGVIGGALGSWLALGSMMAPPPGF